MAAPAACRRHEAAGDHALAVERHVVAGFHARVVHEFLHAGTAVTHAGNDPGASEWAMAGATPSSAAGDRRLMLARSRVDGVPGKSHAMDAFAVEVAESWQAVPH